MASPILSSALTGEADFAGSIFGTNQEASEPAEQTQPETQEAQGTAQPEPTPETKAPIVNEPKTTTRPKATTKEAGDKVEKVTEQAAKATKTEDSSGDMSDDDLPTNPHFQDKKVADSPDGDDSEKGITSWKEIKSEMKKAREERDRLKAELDAAKEMSAKVNTNEYEALKTQLEEYKTKIAEMDQELKVANFERTPAYIENVKKPLIAMQDDLRGIAEANNIDYAKLWQAVAEPNMHKRAEMLDDVTGDMRRMEQMTVIKMADKYQDLFNYHQRLEKESQTLNEEHKARQAQAEQEFMERDQRLQKSFVARNWTAMEDRYSFLKEIEGQDDWNSSLRNAKRMASETNLDRLSVEDRSTILAKATVVPFLESAVKHYATAMGKAVSERDAKIKELQAQVDAIVKSTPSMGNTSTEEDDDTESSDSGSFTNFGKAILGR